MQTFLYGLLTACITGLTVLAFKHPKGFSRLFPYLMGLATGLFIAVTVWHVAIELTWTNLLPHLVPQKVREARDAVSTLRFPYVWIAISYLSVVAFLWIILKLPPFLQVAEKDRPRTDGQSSKDDKKGPEPKG
ncbi:MAG TPA: hypothetical protein VLS27_02620 [Gammaproteobacteria bacterium]|nr:hypothetical protein [Gammaproteobacteria bacterium]